MGFLKSRLVASLIGAIILGLGLTPAVTAQNIGVPAGAQPWPSWPHSRSDLKPEAGVIFGVLPNGMRYAIQRNATPTGRVEMRMNIRAGSMHEGPGQEGVAHLLEHMAFHGSTNLADGQILNILAQLGMRMGPDANAGTSSFYTRYMLDLPRGDANSIDTALGLMREFASELTLSPAALDNERAVVLAEERARAGGDMALTEAIMRMEVGDHPFARPTIGLTDVIRNAPVSRLRSFYDAFYRPERTTLVIVGDTDPVELEAKIKRRFSDWQGRGPAGADPAPVSGRAIGKNMQMNIVPGAPGNGIRMMWRHAYQAPNPSRAARLEMEVEALGQLAMLTRLRELSEAAGQPFLSADPVYYSKIPGVSRTSVLEATFINDLAKSVEVLVQAQRQVSEQGITKVELDRAIANRRLALQNRIAATPSRETPALTAALLNYAVSDELTLEARESLALLDEVAKTVTPEQVNRLLRAHFEGEPAIAYYGATEPAGGQAALASAFTKARAAPLATYAAANLKPWTHTNFGPAGKVVERKTREDLGVTMVKFANGVRLTVKPTTFSRDNVLVKVRFGYGQLHLPRNALTADFATTILNGGGFTDMTRSEQVQSLAGKQVIAVASQEDDAYEYTNPLGVPTANLDLQMQLFAASFSRAGYRTDDWAVTIRSGAESNRATPFDPERLYNQLAPPMLHGGDIRWEASTPEQHASWDPKDAVAFIKPILETYPLEVIMVGDVTVEQAIASTAKTLGAMPPRRPVAEPKDLRVVKFPAGTPRPIDIKHKGRPDQSLLVVQWPATDAFANPRETQAAAMLSTILGSRLSHELREKQGRTYSPHAYDALSTVLPGYGVIGVEITLQPADIPGALTIIDAIALDLATTPPSSVEFAAAVAPQLEGIKRAQQDNRYWFALLNNAHEDPRLMDLVASTSADTAALTPNDIRAAAQKWLVREKAWKMTVTPEGTTAQVENFPRPYR